MTTNAHVRASQDATANLNLNDEGTGVRPPNDEWRELVLSGGTQDPVAIRVLRLVCDTAAAHYWVHVHPCSPIFNEIQRYSPVLEKKLCKVLADGHPGATVRATRCELGQLALRNQGKSE